LDNLNIEKSQSQAIISELEKGIYEDHKLDYLLDEISFRRLVRYEKRLKDVKQRNYIYLFIVFAFLVSLLGSQREKQNFIRFKTFYGKQDRDSAVYALISNLASKEKSLVLTSLKTLHFLDYKPEGAREIFRALSQTEKGQIRKLSELFFDQ